MRAVSGSVKQWKMVLDLSEWFPCTLASLHCLCAPQVDVRLSMGCHGRRWLDSLSKMTTDSLWKMTIHSLLMATIKPLLTEHFRFSHLAGNAYWEMDHASRH
jgi:hypothetical protein